MAAKGAVATSVGSAPGASGGKKLGAGAFEDVGHGADNHDGDIGTVANIDSGGREKAPRTIALDDQVVGAGDVRWRGVNYGDLLAAKRAVATGIGSAPSASGGKKLRTSAFEDIRHGADDHDGDIGAVANIDSGGGEKAPRTIALDDQVVSAGDVGRCGVNDGDFLAAERTVAASVGRSPGAGDGEELGTGALADIGQGADNHDGDIGAVADIDGGGGEETPRTIALDDQIVGAGDIGWLIVDADDATIGGASETTVSGLDKDR